jgi:hypothetical protein
MSIGKGFVRSCLGAMALFVLQAGVPALAGDDAHSAAVDDALAKWKAAGHSRPIVESHIHLTGHAARWRAVADAGGRADLPRHTSAEYLAVARPNGVAGRDRGGERHRRGQPVDPRLVRNDRFFSFFVGNLEIAR